jgi:hypothetical protein
VAGVGVMRGSVMGCQKSTSRAPPPLGTVTIATTRRTGREERRPRSDADPCSDRVRTGGAGSAMIMLGASAVPGRLLRVSARRGCLAMGRTSSFAGPAAGLQVGREMTFDA